MAKRDYYDVLGVSKTATADEIKRAHRKLVRQYHPDVNKNNKGAEEKFKEVQEAYDVLSDAEKRTNYDQFGHAGVGGMGGAGRPGAAGPRARVRPMEPQRGADVNHPVTLSFDQAARGTKIPLQINRDGRLETIDVNIPAGVNEGSKVRLKGKGQQSATGEPGDLYIITHIRPHPYFRREDLDILLDLPISLYEALNGTKVSVPTL